MSEADVADLVVSRGYVKGAITRLYNALCDKEAKLVLTVTELKTRRERAVGSFAEYEALNKQILSLKPADTEDVEMDAATARAYQLDRDADEEADTEGFLKFLERRALAFENSEPASSASKPSPKAVNAVATDNKQACRFFVAAVAVSGRGAEAALAGGAE
ncbi:hypothetical protein NE865_14789 [Phthorimaea operculella]|nr:hypothetical protein NE865_14789 [Phthorimaea operculella]